MGWLAAWAAGSGPCPARTYTAVRPPTRSSWRSYHQLQRPVQIDVSRGISRENCEFYYSATVSLRETFLGFPRFGVPRRRRGIHVIFRDVWGFFESRWGRSFSPAIIALIKSEDIAKNVLTAMHLPAEVPELHPARPPPHKAETGADDWGN
jgi:hypothetical protein